MTSLPPLDHDPGQLRELARTFVDDPRFQDAAPGVLDRVGEFLLRWLVRFLDAVAGAVGNAEVVAWGVVLVGVVVLALVVWRVLRGASRDRGGLDLTGAAVGRTATDWRAEALLHEADGRTADAVLAWYRAAVATLVERGVLDDVPGRTVRELDGELEVHAPDLAPLVAAAGAAVDRVWYGRAAANDDDVAAARHAAEVTSTSHVTPAAVS
ncbi:DUF4129 domain-containing protein [Nitriliruptoraceae bacterium ZYF776]|nr:DUF4129 domain-containing protein [Profundirhabdus halotolerans]